MLYITGDTHGCVEDTKKITRLRKKLTAEDYVIICGDFGYVWTPLESPSEKWRLDWFEKYLPCPLLFIDGNHENFDRLKSYPHEMWHGGKVQYIRPNVIHLERGQTYSIGGYEVFAFGGAPSHDKSYRKEHVSWWADEMPSEAEISEGRRNLHKPDIVITHFLPESIDPYETHSDFGKFLDEIYRSYGQWFCGHYHSDREYKGIHLVYNNIKELP